MSDIFQSADVSERGGRDSKMESIVEIEMAADSVEAAVAVTAEARHLQREVEKQDNVELYIFDALPHRTLNAHHYFRFLFREPRPAGRCFAGWLSEQSDPLVVVRRFPLLDELERVTPGDVSFEGRDHGDCPWLRAIHRPTGLSVRWVARVYGASARCYCLRYLESRLAFNEWYHGKRVVLI